ncbi:MAG: hypothetical protein WCK53_10450, partial [Methanomicrobiales archaeon]
MNRDEKLPWVIFRTMESWLMSSGKVAIGLRTEWVRLVSRLIVSHCGALTRPGAIWKLANPVF